MSFDEIVERILSSCPGVSRESVLEKLEAERSRAGGLISDEALLRMIAAGFGCEILGGEATVHVLLMRDLIPGLNGISVVGRVVAVFSPRAFNGNRKGRFASLLIADESGVLRVVLWNDKAGLAESGGVKVGEIVRFRHGYTREDFGGKVEVHIGEKCIVEVNPADVKSKDYPSIGKFTTKIDELSNVQKGHKVNLAGTVKRLGSVSEFERSDSSVGKVMRFILSDGSREVAVVVWNEKVDEIEGLVKVGAGLQVVNGKVKKAAGGGLEVHVDSATYVGVQALSEFSPLASLKEGLGQINVVGEVATRPMVREVKTSKQEILKLATFELKDETGRMWVSAWRNHADSVKDLNVGDRIVIKNAYVKKGFGDQLELSIRNATSIDKET
ncbi:MAG: OB-fold nucleic acid binding domain-containing protein [Candidatus Bathyarchaeia archaeon]|jgi:replication factor A1